MMELPLPFIGWFFTLFCTAGLLIGAALMFVLYQAGEMQRRYLGYAVWNDALLAGIWILGLAGGIGVIRLQPWGRHLLELFCWALIVLVVLSAASRLYGMRRPSDAPPVNWVAAISGLTLVLIPLLALCAATIITLRSPAAQQAFSAALAPDHAAVRA